MNNVEILGIAASLCVVISFTLKGEWRIRLVNSLGATLFVIYGILIRAWSIWILNIVLLGVHIYFLFRPQKKKVDVDKQNEK